MNAASWKELVPRPRGRRFGDNEVSDARARSVIHSGDAEELRDYVQRTHVHWCVATLFWRAQVCSKVWRALCVLGGATENDVDFRFSEMAAETVAGRGRRLHPRKLSHNSVHGGGATE
jgi:hypothetical protein